MDLGYFNPLLKIFQEPFNLPQNKIQTQLHGLLGPINLSHTSLHHLVSYMRAGLYSVFKYTKPFLTSGSLHCYVLLESSSTPQIFKVLVHTSFLEVFSQFPPHPPSPHSLPIPLPLYSLKHLWLVWYIYLFITHKNRTISVYCVSPYLEQYLNICMMPEFFKNTSWWHKVINHNAILPLNVICEDARNGCVILRY